MGIKFRVDGSVELYYYEVPIKAALTSIKIWNFLRSVNTASIKTVTQLISYHYNANVRRYFVETTSTSIASLETANWRRNQKKLTSKMMTRYSGVLRKDVGKETCMNCCVLNVINITVLSTGFTRKYIFL